VPTIQRRITAYAFAGLLFSVPSFAQAVSPSPHVRPVRELESFVANAARRSPTIRELLDRLEDLDVTVYIRRSKFMQGNLEGRVGLMSVVGSHRYLIIELAHGRADVNQISILGHELFHAVEIAAETSIVDTPTLAAFYAQVGTLIGEDAGRRSFETAGAAAAGRRTQHEWLFGAQQRTQAVSGVSTADRKE
jgi:hypothetical protein